MPRTDITPARLTIHGVPLRYHDVEIDHFSGNLEAKLKIREYIDSLSHHIGSGKGLFLYGPNGTGKTILAVTIIKAVMRKGLLAHFYPWPALLAARTRGWTDHVLTAEYEMNVFGSSLLVIDDLGKELAAGKDLSVSTFDQVIRTRSNRFKPTIITTNADPTAIRKVYGDSIASLMNGCMEQVLVQGDDHRSFE